MDRLRANRAGLVIALLVVAVAVLVTLLTPRTDEQAFSPESVDLSGGRAVARVLADQGVQVVQERTFAGVQDALVDPDGTTVLVTAPDLVSPQRWAALAASGADLVLLRPDEEALAALTPDVVPTGTASTAERDPGCEVADAVAAGPARAGGRTYAAEGRATACYGGSWVRVQDGATTLTVVGQPALMTNRWVAEDGNAALALRTLGAHERLVWYLPDPLDTEDPALPLSALVPDWLWPALALAGVAGGLGLLWRGRRLGRLVDEPLPVVVRAAETVEGHGRLYASARAVDRAAHELRAASMRRLRAASGLEPTAGVSDVADQVAWVTGRPAPAVRELLSGAVPRDDPALVRLALDLDALERDVRGTTPRKVPQ